MTNEKCAINFDAINTQASPDDRVVEVERQITSLLEKWGTIPLTECIQEKTRHGHIFIVKMDQRQTSTDFGAGDKGKFKLHLIRHEDGRKPKLGDIFSWVVSEKTTFIGAEGKRLPMNTKEKSRLMRFCKKPGDRFDWRIWRKHTLDKNCDFVCDYFDAMALLTNKSDLSDYDERGPDSWYWLVEEVLPTRPLDIFDDQVEPNTPTEETGQSPNGNRFA